MLRRTETANDADLSTTANAAKAADIADQALNQLTSLRGRLGAFEQTTLDTNIATLGDTVNALSNAQSTVQDADKTYVLDAGTVLEEGTHAELMERGGRYRLLVQSQALSTL